VISVNEQVFNRLVRIAESKGVNTPKNILEILEPYRAKRAIFLAAGFGSRMMPLTATIPKPLVVVNGVRIIDTLIDACLAADIEEIYIVRGYLAKEFDVLLEKYPKIRFIENPDYDKANNIASAYLARELLQNAYVLEADLVISNPSIIRKYNYESNVLGIWKEESNDWCLTPDSEGYVIEETTSGHNSYQMVGIYYWSEKDAKLLSGQLKTVYEETPGGKDRYWETVPNQVYRGTYRIKIVPCEQSDVIEIDTYDELKAIDSTYK